MLNKRLLSSKTNEESDNGVSAVKNRKKREVRNVLMKIVNRESSGFFNYSLYNKSHQKIFGHDEHILKFCLKDVIPRYLNDHIFMGLSR